MKKDRTHFACAALITAALVCLASGSVWAQRAPEREGDWEYEVNFGSPYDARITKYRGPGGAVTIPSRLGGHPVTLIWYAAFENCASLTSVDIPESVTEIWGSAFDGCTGLTSIFIPRSVTRIHDAAFPRCTALQAITVAADNPAYASRDGVLFDKGYASLITYPGGKQGSYSVPRGVTTIADSAFAFCPGLTLLVIPRSVTEIGETAFSGCTGLTSLDISESVTTIETWAFRGCTGISEETREAIYKRFGSWSGSLIFGERE
jgi:hypothetical protein